MSIQVAHPSRHWWRSVKLGGAAAAAAQGNTHTITLSQNTDTSLARLTPPPHTTYCTSQNATTSQAITTTSTYTPLSHTRPTTTHLHLKHTPNSHFHTSVIRPNSLVTVHYTPATPKAYRTYCKQLITLYIEGESQTTTHC